jgi:hypothetical protein
MTKNLILAAANRYFVTTPIGDVHEIVLVDSGHFCNNMQSVIKLLKALGCTLEEDTSVGDRAQGFIDESGRFHNRSEAYKIAKSSGQPFNSEYTLPNNKLDSSCIRHFGDYFELAEYIPTPVACCMRNEMGQECECENKGITSYKSQINGDIL